MTRRHELDPISLTFGLLFTGLGLPGFLVGQADQALRPGGSGPCSCSPSAPPSSSTLPKAATAPRLKLNWRSSPQRWTTTPSRTQKGLWTTASGSPDGAGRPRSDGATTSRPGALLPVLDLIGLARLEDRTLLVEGDVGQARMNVGAVFSSMRLKARPASSASSRAAMSMS